MKKWSLVATVLSLLVFTSCQKEVSVDSVNNGGNPGAGNNEDYQPVSAGSEWTYSSISLGNYSVKSLGTDSMINGLKYYKFDNINSLGTSRVYIHKNNGVYTQAARTVMSGDFFQMIVLKDAAIGTTWTNKLTSSGYSNYHTFTVAAKGIQRTVNGKVYNNVIELDHDFLVDDVMGGSPVSIGGGKAFFAKGVGGIENYYTADMFGLQIADSVYLVSATIR